MPTLFKRLSDHLTRSTQDLDADALQVQCGRLGSTPIDHLADRAEVAVSGTIRNVTTPPRCNVAALVAELYDGSGSVDLIWLGRREIVGIGPGIYLRASGRICTKNGRRVIFNPRYDVLPRPGE